jgi:hypothetical protein
MALNRTQEEVMQRRVEAMGERLGRLFDALWYDVGWLHSTWNEFLAVFASEPSCVDLLNKAAPVFFRMVQDVVFDWMVLNVARLTDRTESKGKSNLTIQWLPELVGPDETVREVTERVQEALAAAEFCRQRRNRQLAHRDLALAVGEKGVAPLEPATIAKFRAALAALSATLNAVEDHYMRSHTLFDEGGRRPGGALSLLGILHEGTEARDARMERKLRGEPR